MDQGANEIKTLKPPDSVAGQSFWNYGDKNAAQIQREIQVTRADLDETVNAIQARLSPQELFGHVADMARDAIRQGSPRLAEAVRHNPLPAALTAVGLGWLLLKAVNPTPPERRIRGYERDSGSETEDEYGLMEEGKYTAGKVKDKTLGAIESATESSKEWASGAAGKIKDTTSKVAGQAREKAGQLADKTKEKAGEFADATLELAGKASRQARRGAISLGHSTSRQLSRVGKEFSETFQENPLAIGAACLGIGAAIGMSLRATHKERELMGQASDAVVTQAEEAGRETLEKAQKVVGAAQSAMKEEAHKQDLL